jgi:hypothetical protein
MTISAQVNRIAYTGDGGTVAFPFPYKFLNTADLVVTSVVTLTGVETVKTITTHYTVSGEGTDDSGNVTMLVAPASTETLVIYSDPAIAQGTDFVNGGSLDVDNIEATVDELTLICRRLDDRIDRSLRQPEGDVADIDFIPSKVERANMYLSFDADGDPQVNVGTLGSAVSAYWYVILATETEGAAKAALNLEIGVDVQAWDAQLDDLAGLTPTNSNIIVGDGANWVTETGATARTSLGVAIGVDVQAYDAQLDDLAGLTPTDGFFVVGDNTNWITESGDTARISMGVGSTDSPTFTNLTLTGTEAIQIPVGDDAERPGTPAEGDVRGNTDTHAKAIEAYLSAAWQVLRVAGLEPVWLPAQVWTPRETNGAVPQLRELATNDIMINTLLFDPTTSWAAHFSMAMPKSWNEGTVTYVPFWTAASGSGTVIWDLAGRAYGDSDALDTAPGTAISVTDTLLTANDLHKGPTSAAVTMAGSPAEDDLIILEISLDVAGTLAVDAELIGVMVYVTFDLPDDS